MPRAYRQFCGVARALDVVGDRWTLLIVRDLLLGPLRFSDLEALERGIGPNLLTQRLQRLEAEGLVETRRLPPPARAKVYALTEQGEALRPVVLALGRFGSSYLDRPGPEDRIHLGWAVFSFQRRFVGADRAAEVELSTAEEAFTIRFTEDEIWVRRGEAERPDARVRGEFAALGPWLRGGRQWRDLVEEGALRVDGDAEAFDALSRGLGL